MTDVTVRDVMAALEAIAPRRLALENDPGGLLVGDETAHVTGITVALDATLPLAREAAAQGLQMIVSHHPLIYRPARTVRADDPIGAVVLACARSGVAVAAAHTNWDVADGGVNDVLASLLGLTQVRPLRITHRETQVKIIVFVPATHRDVVLEAMSAAGAGVIGDYDRCAFWTPGTGTFRPLQGASPSVGTVGTVKTTDEERLEVVAPSSRWVGVVTAMIDAHPYEEVAYDVYPLQNGGPQQGLGRIGRLPEPITAADLLARARASLTFPEVRMAGPSERLVQTVAVCGGAGAELMHDALTQGADALVTADVRHHEFVEAAARGFPLLDAGHAATETPGAEELAFRLGAALGPRGVRVAFGDPDGALRAPRQRLKSSR